VKERNLTAVVTGERGISGLTRHGIEEYISDCVILLDHRVTETVSTRHLRVVKYRGSSHGTNEYPFLIDTDGISVLPVTSLELKHGASDERVSTGLPDLDVMLGGKGYFRGGSILISGTAGTGKTTLASHFVHAACGREERCVFFSFEESPDQVARNMRSVGIHLRPCMDKGLLRFYAVRPTSFGLEMHLVKMHKIITQFNPAVVVIDPITAMLQSGTRAETRNMLLRLIDFLREKQITVLMTTLTRGADAIEQSEVEVSSLVDTWLLVKHFEIGGERNRGLYILKARGLPHSNQIRELQLTNQGAKLREVYLGDAGLLTGSARVTQEAKDASEALLARQAIERHQSSLDRKRKMLDSQMAAIQMQLENEEQETSQLIEQERRRLQKLERDREAMAESRAANVHVASGEVEDNAGRTGGR
jgi:circadian clock protein KaiC